MARHFGTWAVDRGSAAFPGYTFGEFTASGVFGRADGGFGFSSMGTEVVSYDANGRSRSRQLEFSFMQRTLRGGGTLTYVLAGSTNCIKWTVSFRATTFNTLTSGSNVLFPMPAVNATISVSDGSSRIVTSDGISLNSHEVLYASVANDGSVTYGISIEGSNFVLLDNTVIICTISQGGGAFTAQFGNGVQIRRGDGYVPNSRWSRTAYSDWTLYGDDLAALARIKNGEQYWTSSAGYQTFYTITSGGTDSKIWRINILSGMFSIDVMKDDLSSGLTVLGMKRTGIAVTETNVSGHWINYADGSCDLGSLSFRWRNLHLVNQPTISSDITTKGNIREFSKAEMDAWSSVSPKIYNVLSSDMFSAGLIAQEVLKAFTDNGLDPEKYTLFEKDKTTNKYSLRYGEAAMFEAAYQRTRLTKMETVMKQTEAVNKQLQDQLASVMKALGLLGIKL